MLILKTEKCSTFTKTMDTFLLDQETFEQITLPEDDCKEEAEFLLENATIDVLFYDDSPIGIQLPPSMNLKVTQTDPGLKGDTAQGGSKPATVETGLVVQVPLFIDEGNIIKVDTRTKDYLERVSIDSK